MKKNLKRIGALVLALCLVLALSVTAFAADDTYDGSGSPNSTAGVTNSLIDGNNIPLTKGVVLFNTDGSDIREPNISFTYAVTPADVTDGAVTVTDDGSLNLVGGVATPVTVTVYDGVAGAFPNTLTLSFADSNTLVTAPVSGVEVEKTGYLVIDPSVFTHAGVYRYVITETANPTDVTAKGLDARDSAYDNTRYLDVYIKNGTSGLELYGAVIFKSSTSTPGQDIIDPNDEKTTGFEPGDSDYENDPTVDKYHTFNLEVSKAITGSLADKTHDFPFEITITGDKAAAITADYDNGSATYDGTAPSTINVSTTAVTLKPKMSDGDSVTITGIPAGTTVMVKETNDTYDEYTPSITTETGFSSLALTETGKLTALTGTTQLSAAATISDKTQNSVIGLTNNLAEISPTGVVLRFAPYALILAAGLALLFLSIYRRRMADDEA